MAIFYLVRHGEADYSEMLEKGFYGFGRSFAPLSEKGIIQAETTAVDDRLKTAEIGIKREGKFWYEGASN